MKFQGRGNAILRALDANGVPGPGILICPDTFAIAFGVDSFEHTNKCGLQDVIDYRGIKSISGTLSFSFSDVEDRNFAIAALGTVNAGGGAPVAVTGELLSDDLVDDDFTYLGNGERHYTITALVIKDSASPQGTAVLNTDYTLDAATGKVTWLDVSGFTQPFEAAYSHVAPASVSLLTAPTREYNVTLEFTNRANANDPGSLELYKVRFDPAGNLDFMSDELQIPDLTGSILADTSRVSTDTAFGQFGRRIL